MKHRPHLRPEPAAATACDIPPAPRSAGRRSAPPLFFRGWFVVAGAFIVMMVGFGAAYSFAAFAEALEAEFGASRAKVSIVFGLCGFTTFTVSAVSGPLADHIGPRPLAAAGMLLVGLGLITAATATTLLEVMLCYGLIIGLGVGFAYVPAVAAVQRWFVSWRGLASGIAAAGIGFGTALVPPAAQALADFGDWRVAFVVSGFTAAIVGVAGAMLLAASPEQYGRRPDGDVADAPTAVRLAARDGSEIGATLRSRAFLLLYGGTLLLSVPVSLPFAHLADTAQRAGLPRAESLALLSVVGTASIAGRFLLGALADKIGRRATLLSCCAGVTAMTALWAVADAALLTPFAIGFGVFYGGFVALLPAVSADCFGQRNAAGIIGVLYTGRGIALLLAAPLLAVLVESAGSYRLPLLLAALLGAAGAAMIALAKSGCQGGASACAMTAAVIPSGNPLVIATSTPSAAAAP